MWEEGTAIRAACSRLDASAMQPAQYSLLYFYCNSGPLVEPSQERSKAPDRHRNFRQQQRTPSALRKLQIAQGEFRIKGRDGRPTPGIRASEAFRSGTARHVPSALLLTGTQVAGHLPPGRPAPQHFLHNPRWRCLLTCVAAARLPTGAAGHNLAATACICRHGSLAGHCTQ